MSIDDVWQQANPDAGPEEVTLDPPADGEYSVELTEAFAGVGKESGKAFVALTFTDLASQYKWKVLGGFKSQGQANMTKKLVRDLGVDVDSITFSDLADVLKDKAGDYFHVTVKTNGSFRNTYVTGPARGGLPAADVKEQASCAPVTVPDVDGGDDDIPF